MTIAKQTVANKLAPYSGTRVEKPARRFHRAPWFEKCTLHGMISHPIPAIDESVYALYCLTPDEIKLVERTAI